MPVPTDRSSVAAISSPASKGAVISSVSATYVFQTPVLGAQAAISLLGVAGRNHASIEATLTGPLGNSIWPARGDDLGFRRSLSDGTLKWNFGVHNVMTYLSGDIPVSAYDANRLANLGIGHGAVDWGASAIPISTSNRGLEFSGVFRLHLHLQKQQHAIQERYRLAFRLGCLAIPQQANPCRPGRLLLSSAHRRQRRGRKLGPFKSQVAGVSPQIGWLFPVADDMQGLSRRQGHKEFAAENRPEELERVAQLRAVAAHAEQAPPPLLTRKY